MNEIVAIAEVVGLFFLRIGLPLLLLVTLGILIDKWQTRRNEAIKRMYKPNLQVVEEEHEEKRKAA